MSERPNNLATSAPVPILNSESDGRVRRRSSFAARVGSLREVGGPNSFNNFARSWHRASSFYSRGENVSDSEVAVEEEDSVSPFAESGVQSPPPVLDEPPVPPSRRTSRNSVEGRLQNRRSVFEKKKSLAVPVAQSNNYLNSNRNGAASPARSSIRWQGQDAPTEDRLADEETPLVRKRAVSDISVPVLGESTFYQTSLNLTNALIGMSMLAVPYGMRLSGWIPGIVLFSVAAMVTSFTGTLLARCLEKDPSGSLGTYDDLAFVAFGQKAKLVIRALFVFELMAVCVALVILGADCFHSLVPDLNLIFCKFICGAIITPLCALPMRVLSITSVLGIMSTIAIIVIVFVAGLSKPHGYGSLRSPAPTNLWPEDWAQLPKAFGMLMACYGAHSIFPNMYRDMRKPYKFDRAIFMAYAFAWIVQLSLGVTGYLMYGRHVKGELTVNVFETPGYAQWITSLIIIAMAILPLTKIPINVQPIITTLFTILRVNRPPTKSLTTTTTPPLRTRILRASGYVLVPVVLVLVSILIPSFDHVLSILGNLLCCLICVVFPCLFHLRLYGKELPLWRKGLEWTLVVLFLIPAVVGTGFTLFTK